VRLYLLSIAIEKRARVERGIAPAGSPRSHCQQNVKNSPLASRKCLDAASAPAATATQNAGRSSALASGSGSQVSDFWAQQGELMKNPRVPHGDARSAAGKPSETTYAGTRQGAQAVRSDQVFRRFSMFCWRTSFVESAEFAMATTRRPGKRTLALERAKQESETQATISWKSCWGHPT
jgi:hypothetical protein